MSGHSECVGALLLTEKEHLLPLATESFDLAEVSFPRVDQTGCAKVRTNSYSVPLKPGSIVEARVYSCTVEFRHHGSRIASHERCYSRLQGLVAGYYSSGDSARPGFGCYFGRDRLYTLYAVNAMGDFALSRESLEFLISRQRSDGKMMHEYSQTAALIDWKSLPYMYASADATPLFLTAMLDYVQSSGDIAFLQQHRSAVESAWRFEPTHDSDGDGVFDNAQGTGWVESYLALLDQQASSAMAALSRLLGDPATSRAAGDRATKLANTIEAEYYQPATHDYAFSRNADGSLDHAATIYPSLAWWNGGAGLKGAAASFRRWDSHEFSTDWGLRDVAESYPIYDPISYHQCSVWPLFTG